MPDQPPKCPKKDTIDDEAQAALDELGKVVTSDNKLKMHLDVVKDHLKTILGDHHHL
jgi:hypothetical protein